MDFIEEISVKFNEDRPIPLSMMEYFLTEVGKRHCLLGSTPINATRGRDRYRILVIRTIEEYSESSIEEE